MSFVGMIKTAIHKQFRNQIKYAQSLRGGLCANVRNAMSRLVIWLNHIRNCKNEVDNMQNMKVQTINTFYFLSEIKVTSSTLHELLDRKIYMNFAISADWTHSQIQKNKTKQTTDQDRENESNEFTNQLGLLLPSERLSPGLCAWKYLPPRGDHSYDGRPPLEVFSLDKRLRLQT